MVIANKIYKQELISVEVFPDGERQLIRYSLSNKVFFTGTLDEAKDHLSTYEIMMQNRGHFMLVIGTACLRSYDFKD
jgi:hypothetical protein